MVLFILTLWDTGWIKYVQVYKVFNTVPVAEQLNGMGVTIQQLPTREEFQPFFLSPSLGEDSDFASLYFSPFLLF